MENFLSGFVEQLVTYIDNICATNIELSEKPILKISKILFFTEKRMVDYELNSKIETHIKTHTVYIDVISNNGDVSLLSQYFSSNMAKEITNLSKLSIDHLEKWLSLNGISMPLTSESSSDEFTIDIPSNITIDTHDNKLTIILPLNIVVTQFVSGDYKNEYVGQYLLNSKSIIHT